MPPVAAWYFSLLLLFIGDLLNNQKTGSWLDRQPSLDELFNPVE